MKEDENMEMYLNDWALLSTILGNITSQKALALYGLIPDRSPKKILNLTEKQALNIKFLTKTMTWNELGKEFGISGQALQQQVYKVLKKLPRSSAKLPQ